MVNEMPRRVTIYEVGPRDGLQNESAPVETAAKVRYIDMLSEAGLPAIEATAFVHPRAVPQLADAVDVYSGLKKRTRVRYPALVPNQPGMRRALEAGVDEVAVFTAASESFTRANINCTIDESFERFAPVVALAQEHGVRLRGYVSTAFGCPYEGFVPEWRVLEVTTRLFELGIQEVSIGDTIGVATPGDVDRVMSPLLERFAADTLAVHFHDTRGTALVNVHRALQMGITTVDSSSAGLGGCPYAPGASGNLATEDLVYMLHGMGIETGVDLDKLVAASRFIMAQLGKPPAGRYLQASIAHEQISVAQGGGD
jgi:hydroxymethylglutaryl-CoA lyase